MCFLMCLCCDYDMTFLLQGVGLGFEELFEDERDVVVPGEQLRHAPPFAARDDLCGPRGLWAHATGQTLNTHYIFV